MCGFGASRQVGVRELRARESKSLARSVEDLGEHSEHVLVVWR